MPEPNSSSLPTTTTQPPTISVSLSSLQSNNIPLSTLEAAFGPDSLGIIIVTDLPPEFPALRTRLLSLSSYLANLPAHELAKLEKPEANYAVGWSLGKETLADGRYDTLKGSYYAQPIHDVELEERGRERYSTLPEFTSENVWPDEEVLPGFGEVFERLCGLVVDVAALVARACDRFGEKCVQGYRSGGVLENIVRGSVVTKARLLHYFPPPEMANGDAKQNDDDWCATHKDLGALTGLTSQMFVDESLHPPTKHSDDRNAFPDLPEMDAHPDPAAGLWIQDRSGRTTQVHIPRDALAFQTGEALEAITKGKFKAVPHFVRGGKGGGGKIARNTLAVFTQPNLWEVVDEENKIDFASFGQRNLREKV